MKGQFWSKISQFSVQKGLFWLKQALFDEEGDFIVIEHFQWIDLVFGPGARL